jgi:hypothetical protein
MFVSNGSDRINFTADGSVIAGCNAVPIGNGETTDTATCTTGTLAVGMHTIVATFAGDSKRTSATSELTQTVNAQQ